MNHRSAVRDIGAHLTLGMGGTIAVASALPASAAAVVLDLGGSYR
jgi:hypothetical protein